MVFIEKITADLSPYDPMFHMVSEDFYLANPPKITTLDNPSFGVPLYIYRGQGWSAIFEFDDVGTGDRSDLVDIISSIRPVQPDG